MTQLKLALAQMAPALGDLEVNLKSHLDYIQRAQREDIDLVVFPELSLTGYFLRDLVPSVALPLDDKHYLQSIHQAGRGLDVVLGFVEEDNRHRFYIAATYLSQGKILHVHRKVYLPTYGMYEDGKYFAAGDSFRSFATRFGRMGLLICEDAWHLSSAYLQWMDGADILLILNALPAYSLIKKNDSPPNLILPRFPAVYAELLTSFVVYCNRVGSEEGVAFGGGSMVISPTGQVLAQAPPLEEAWIMAEIDLEELRQARHRLPFLRDERLDLTLRELRRIQSAGQGKYIDSGER